MICGHLIILLILKICIIFVHGFKDSNDFLFNGAFEFIDLTHSFDKNTVYWSDSRNFTFTNKIAYLRNDGSWYATNDFCAGEHGGTHIDAPYHFIRNGLRVGDLPIKKLILPLTVIDVSNKVNDDPNFVLYKHHLDFMINNYFGHMEQPCLLIFKFGWSKYFNDRRQFLGVDDKDNFNFPGLSAEVAEWIVDSYKNVVGVGVDIASVDPGSATDYPAHTILLNAGLYILENVKIDEYVPESSCTALVLPMKIARGTGAPLRLVAICPKEKTFTTPHTPLHRL